MENHSRRRHKRDKNEEEGAIRISNTVPPGTGITEFFKGDFSTTEF